MTRTEGRTGRARSGHLPFVTRGECIGHGRRVAACLGVLLTAGCGPSRVLPREASASLDRLELCHPDFARLEEWDQSLAKARRESGPLLITAGLPELQFSALPPLPIPSPPDPGKVDVPSDRESRADYSRARDILVEESEDQYLADLMRLRLRVLAEHEPEDRLDQPEFEHQVRRVGEELASLETRLHALRPNSATDRFFFTSEQILQRGILYTKIEQELHDLRDRRAGELAALLVPREREPKTIALEDLMAIGRSRDERLAAALAALSQSRAELALRPAEIPDWPSVPTVGALALAPGGGEHTALGEILRQTANNTARESLDQGKDLQRALLAARNESTHLRRQIRWEVETLARNFARDWGYELSFSRRRKGKDLTGRLAANLSKYFHRLNEPRTGAAEPTPGSAK